MREFRKLGLAGLAFFIAYGEAEAAPKFEYVKAEEVKKAAKADESDVKWKASAQAGLLLTTGNSSATTLSSGFTSSRKSGKNKLQLDLGGAFARSTVFIASDDNGSGAIEENELQRVTETSSQSWSVKGRYDRFLSTNNALYGSGQVSADKPAGRDFVGSGQLGYSRQLVETKVHLITLESGYDYSYENLDADERARSIHSIRAFAGYSGKLSSDTSLDLSTETLVNLNVVQTSAGPIDRFDDTRFNNKVSLTTTLYGDLSFRFAFQANYDNAPAPRPTVGLPYAEGFRPLAERLDTRTEAAIIVNFL